ncbi:MAG: glutamine synthetase family protein, partial [Pseudomonadota bacterium]
MPEPYSPRDGLRLARTKPEISLGVSPPSDVRTEEALSQWLRDHSVQEIECVCSDFAGIGRGKVMPASKFIGSSQTFMPTSLFFLTITGGYPDLDGLQGYDTDADLMLVPDIATARAVPWANDRSVQVIHDVCSREGELIEFAPRSVLRRVMNMYATRGWQPVVAPELEFYLTRPNTDPDYPLEPPVGRSGRPAQAAQAYSIAAVDEYDSVIEHIYDYVSALGHEIDTINQESGAAQLEINLLHGDPMELADQIFLFKRLIREAAMRCGCYATFMAKPMEEQPGSSMHVHQSVIDTNTGENIFSNPDGSESVKFHQYIGGLQAYFRAGCCLAAPYVNSYRRLVPDMTAPINLDWGTDNRTTGFRAPIAPPNGRRMENRVIGADANPYLAIAATLACGYLGMVEELSPKDEVTTDSYDRPRELPYGLL